MQKHVLHSVQGILVGGLVLILMIVLSACAGVAGSNSTPSQTTGSTTGSTATTGTTSSTQATPTATQAAATQPASQPVAFKTGGISFIGPVKSANATTLVMSAPNGQSYTMAINAQTDRTAYNGGLPPVGSSVNMDAIYNPDGSITATILKPAQAGDPDTNLIAYTGITTSAVGADRVLHFTAGLKHFDLPISQTADLGDFNGNAQAIGVNMSVKVKIQFPGGTNIVSIGNANTGQ